jgi:hypothetical protein
MDAISLIIGLVLGATVGGAYGKHTYIGSGASVQREIIAALRLVGVDARTDQLSAASNFGQATSLWRVTPLILEREDRATEWSGKPDRIRIELRTLDPTGTLINATAIFGISKWVTLGGDHPQDMIRSAILPWAVLFRRTPAAP